ncbi:ABC transporter permease [Micromonospora sp. BRA006-A]|nr:ABC transporter permease [Micromonospora sp. BRA006-A]
MAGTIGLSVRHRRRDLALLRAVAATPGQVRRMLVAEATLLALAGSAIGGPAGLLAARWVHGELVGRGFVPAGFPMAGGLFVVPAAIGGGPRRGGRRTDRRTPGHRHQADRGARRDRRRIPAQRPGTPDRRRADADGGRHLRGVHARRRRVGRGAGRRGRHALPVRHRGGAARTAHQRVRGTPAHPGAATHGGPAATWPRPTCGRTRRAWRPS